jgi:hypothetical protein
VERKTCSCSLILNTVANAGIHGSYSSCSSSAGSRSNLSRRICANEKGEPEIPIRPLICIGAH